MATDKKSFVLYCDMKHTVELLDDALAGKLFKHLLQYVNDENPESNDLLLKVAFEPIKRQLKRDLVDWEIRKEKRVNAGHLGGVKSAESREKKQNKATSSNASNLKQSQANQAVNGTVTVNDNVTVINTVNKLKEKDVWEDLHGKTWPEVKNKWFEDFRWREKICRDMSLTIIQVDDLTQEFVKDLELKDDYKDIPGLKKHFVNWYKKYKNGSATHRQFAKSPVKGISDKRTEAARKW